MDLIKIGKYIAGKRKSLGMTQKQLAEKIGMSDKSVSKWERGICLPDVSVYLELCEILGISLNEFLAGEDIEIDNIEKKSEDTLIQITKDSGRKQRYLKRIIIVLLIVVGISMVTFGSVVCNKLRQPQNYIEAVDSDSIEILEGVKNREYYGRSATTIENKCKIEYGTEQGLAALIYGEKGLSSLPIQDIAGEHINTDNEYMYYYSVEFIK